MPVVGPALVALPLWIPFLWIVRVRLGVHLRDVNFLYAKFVAVRLNLLRSFTTDDHTEPHDHRHRLNQAEQVPVVDPPPTDPIPFAIPVAVVIASGRFALSQTSEHAAPPRTESGPATHKPTPAIIIPGVQ